MSFTALTIYNFSTDQKAAGPTNQMTSGEKGTIITDLVVATLLIVAAVVLVVLEKMGINIGLVGTIVSASAGGVGLIVCIADKIALIVLYARRSNQQPQNLGESQEVIQLKQELEALKQKEVEGNLTKEELEKAREDVRNKAEEIKKQKTELVQLREDKLNLTAIKNSAAQTLAQTNQQVESLKLANDQQQKEISELKKNNAEQKEVIDKQASELNVAHDALQKQLQQAQSKIPTWAKVKVPPNYFSMLGKGITATIPEHLWNQLDSLKDMEALCFKEGDESYELYYYKAKPDLVYRQKLTKEKWENRANDPLLNKLKFISLPV